MILVDTSVWIEYDRASGSYADLALRSLIRAGEPIACTEPVLMEVLAGARDVFALARLRKVLTSFGWIALDPETDFEGAATVFRSCRRVGITPRGLVDCMVATIALRTDAALLGVDRDFSQIAGVLPLRLHP